MIVGNYHWIYNHRPSIIRFFLSKHYVRIFIYMEPINQSGNILHTLARLITCCWCVQISISKRVQDHITVMVVRFNFETFKYPETVRNVQANKPDKIYILLRANHRLVRQNSIAFFSCGTASNTLYLQMKVQVLLAILLIGSMIDEQDAFIKDLVIRTIGHGIRHIPVGRRRRRRRRWSGDEGRPIVLYRNLFEASDSSSVMAMRYGR